MIQYKKVAFYTLGCKLNFSETSTISRLFEDAGFAKVEFEEHPDIYVINTCSVTENADKKCKQLVKKALSINPNAFIAIIGWAALLTLVNLRKNDHFITLIITLVGLTTLVVMIEFMITLIENIN